jgi:hypothetical protein
MKVRERPTVNKQGLHRFRMKLSEAERREKYHADISNRFEALEDLDTEVEIKCLGNN